MESETSNGTVVCYLTFFNTAPYVDTSKKSHPDINARMASVQYLKNGLNQFHIYCIKAFLALRDFK